MNDYGPDHKITECNLKLIALLDKLIKIDTRDPSRLPYLVDDAKALARELRLETKYLHRSR